MKRLSVAAILFFGGLGSSCVCADDNVNGNVDAVSPSLRRKRALAGTQCITACVDGITPCFESTSNIDCVSCNGHSACYGSSGGIADISCNDQLACGHSTATIGRGSCNNLKSCCGATGVIEDNTCNEPGECCDPENCPFDCPEPTTT